MDLFFRIANLVNLQFVLLAVSKCYIAGAVASLPVCEASLHWKIKSGRKRKRVELLYKAALGTAKVFRIDRQVHSRWYLLLIWLLIFYIFLFYSQCHVCVCCCFHLKFFASILGCVLLATSNEYIFWVIVYMSTPLPLYLFLSFSL